MTSPDADVVSYLVVVRGLHEAAYKPFAKKFLKHRSGAKPGPQPREINQVVDCQLGDVSDALAWIAEVIPGKYKVLELGISIYAPRNWANFDIPAEIVQATNQFGATLRVMFSSPMAS